MPARQTFHQPRIHVVPKSHKQIVTISTGVLHMRENVFGRTRWLYDLHATKTQCDRRISYRKVLLWSCVFLAIFIVLTFALGYTILDHWNETNVIQTKKSETFQLNGSQIKTEPIIKPSNHLELKNVETNSECSNCRDSEICFQNATKSRPECAPIEDAADPTGCGGLCKLEKQYCKILDFHQKIASCIDIERLVCLSDQWKCHETLMCIKREQYCDGIVQCVDKSDEFNCECNLLTHFQCTGNISCLANQKKCNGSVDCWDASDEIGCIHDCDLNHVSCYNGECIETEQFCDGTVNCKDKSDEPEGCERN